MNLDLLYIILAVGSISLLSLVGVLYFFLREKTFHLLLPYLVAFAAGTLIAVGFFELIPESFEAIGHTASLFVVVGILVFLLFEHVIHWHHSHSDECEDCEDRAVGYSILLGDGLHNLIDGMIIGSAFLLNPATGIAATVAAAAHEIPQELGDYSVLVKSGFTKLNALLFNFLSALAAVIGGVTAFYFFGAFEQWIPYVLAIGAGGFLYIALVDLVSEFKEDDNLKVVAGRLTALVGGIALIYLLH